MVPAFFIMFVVIALALRSEGQMVPELLTPDFQSGLMFQQSSTEGCSSAAHPRNLPKKALTGESAESACWVAFGTRAY